MEDIKTIVSIAGLLFAISNAVFLFIWNNLKADNKQLKADMEIILNKLDNKADKALVAERRSAELTLHARLDEVIKSSHESELRLSNQIAELKGAINARTPTRNR